MSKPLLCSTCNKQCYPDDSVSTVMRSQRHGMTVVVEHIECHLRRIAEFTDKPVKNEKEEKFA